MLNMHLLAVCSVLFAAAIGTSTALIFDQLFAPRSGCTVKAEVPIVTYHSYYKAEIFPSLDAKLAANQNRFDRDLHQVWVDAPDPSMCGFQSFAGGRCCLNGFFGNQFEFRDFESGEKKKIANEQLWNQAKYQGSPFYYVWVDAPERYCGKNRPQNLFDAFLG